MSPKKKKPAGAQKLIDSLLDEKTSSDEAGVAGSQTSTDPIFMHERAEIKVEVSKPFANLNEPMEVEITSTLTSAGLSMEDSNIGVGMSPGYPQPKNATKDANRDATVVRAAAPAKNEPPPKNVSAKPAASPPPPPSLTQIRRQQEQPPEQVPELTPPPAATQTQKAPTAVALVQPRPKSDTKTEARPEPKQERSHEREDASEIDRWAPTEVKAFANLGKHDKNEAPSSQRSQHQQGGYNSTEAALKQSESLRIAQARLTEFEQEVERLRRENEQLASAGETLRRHVDELRAKSENLETGSRESSRIAEEERKVVRSQMQSKDREISELRARLEESEGRLESNFKKIRVRERELEHRLEIIKMESSTIVSTKDKMLLDLKRQIDQLMHENEFGKQKSQELFNQYKDKQETIRRVVRALRIALTILEGDEDSGAALKKVD